MFAMLLLVTVGIESKICWMPSLGLMFVLRFVRICQQLLKKFYGQHAHKEHGDLIRPLSYFKGRRMGCTSKGAVTLDSVMWCNCHKISKLCSTLKNNNCTVTAITHKLSGSSL